MAKRKHDSPSLRDEVYEHAIKAVLAWELGKAMKRQKITKTALAAKLAPRTARFIACWIRPTMRIRSRR
jgi:hypothetical protein